MTLHELWNLLSKITTLHLHAVSFEPQKPVWKGEAAGRVVQSKADGGALIFSESGEWNFSEKPKIKFFNVYRWRLVTGDEILELSHLRNGLDSPVHLLDFKKAADGTWHSREPHICVDDLYAAVLSVRENSISVKWAIRGPAKKQIVECLYQT
jgi:hypothetical protein